MSSAIHSTYTFDLLLVNILPGTGRPYLAAQRSSVHPEESGHILQNTNKTPVLIVQ